MWKGDEDTNEEGTPVELYSPLQGPPRKTKTSLQDSHIGGHHSFDESFTPSCDLCGDKEFLLAQLKRKNRHPLGYRYLCIFACPKEECFRKIPFPGGFSSGGGGVFKCLEKWVGEDPKSPKVTAPTKSSWYDDNDTNENDDDDDEWGMNSDDDDDENVNLESAIEAMESKLDDDGGLFRTSKKYTSKPLSEDRSEAFGCYLLKQQDEPRSKKSYMEDEDDVGLLESDEKIRNMLARYMAEEEDEDILAALGGGGGGNNVAEEDERLSEDDRLLRTFQDRVRRAPRQVIRYAKGGRPLWSIPDKDTTSGRCLWSVPACSHCGQERIFECQVMPSLLATLEVDKYHPTTTKKTALDDLLSSGLNFGAIAMFTCPNPACPQEEKDACLVVQKSVDDVPDKGTQRVVPGEALPVASMAIVEDLDDDGDFQLDG